MTSHHGRSNCAECALRTGAFADAVEFASDAIDADPDWWVGSGCSVCVRGCVGRASDLDTWLGMICPSRMQPDTLRVGARALTPPPKRVRALLSSPPFPIADRRTKSYYRRAKAQEGLGDEGDMAAVRLVVLFPNRVALCLLSG